MTEKNFEMVEEQRQYENMASGKEDIGDILIKGKMRMEMIRALFPFFVLALSAGATVWALISPDVLRTVSCGIFFTFSLAGIHFAKKLWKS